MQPSRIMDVSSSGMPFLPLLRSYSSFAFRRVTEVQGGPQQVNDATFPLVVLILVKIKSPKVWKVAFIQRQESLHVVYLSTILGEIFARSHLYLFWRSDVFYMFGCLFPDTHSQIVFGSWVSQSLVLPFSIAAGIIPP